MVPREYTRALSDSTASCPPKF